VAIIDFFDRGWRSNRSGVAYIQDSRHYSFDEVGQLSCRIANALLAEGFGREAKGAVWAGNDVTAWSCTLGLWRAGMCWIPVGARNPAAENHFVLDAFDCEVLFFQHEFAPVVAGLHPKLPNVKAWICIDGEAPDVPGARSLQDWIADQPAKRPNVDYDLDDLVVLSATGGTTGSPKGVMNTHRSTQTFCAHFMMSCHYEADERPVNLAAAPITHTAGLLSLPCTARGGTVVVLTKPDPALLLQAIPTHRVTEFFLPPTVIYRLLDIPDLNMRVDFSSLRYFLYGAAPMSVEKLKQAIGTFGPVMMGGYGQTEAPTSISFLTPGEHFVSGQVASDERLSSVGRPNPLVRVEIMNDANEILPPGATGEICVRGPQVMPGYWNRPDETAKVMTADGFFKTGDIGVMDAEGYTKIVDRKKDMILVSGFNVYPNEVEGVVAGHPSVLECAAVGVPDENSGEAVKLFVVKKDAALTEKELMEHCKEHLTGYKKPKYIEFRSDLPKTNVGKILRRELRDEKKAV